MQINNYKKIAEVNLLESNLKQTTVSLEQLGDVRKNDWGWFLSDEYLECDKSLAILSHDIVAKFGFDINEIKIMDSEEIPNAILVSKAKPKFTGSTKTRLIKS